MLVDAPGGRPHGTVEMPGNAQVRLFNPETHKESKEYKQQDLTTRKKQDLTKHKKQDRTKRKKKSKDPHWGGKRPDSASATHHAQALCNGKHLPEDAIRAIRNGTQVKALREAFQALGLPS